MDQSYILSGVQLMGESGISDITIKDGVIAAITETESTPLDSDVQEIDCHGLYVSSGWIDMHVHAFSAFDPYGDDIDEIGVYQGVTTIVDAGSCGADRIKELLGDGEKAKTRLLAFLNISRIGLARLDELSLMEWIDREKVRLALEQYRPDIVGLKARISRSVVLDQGVEPLEAARELSDETGLPLMVHIGSGPPDIREVLPLLQRRDIVTHYLNGKLNNLFDDQGNPLEVLIDAVNRGVHLDVGHGTASFSFKVGEAARRHGIAPNTISTDIYRGNRLHGPVYDMASVLSKFLLLGYPLEQVIEAVTVHAAKWLGRPELGRVQVGDAANLTLFRVVQGQKVLVDSEGEERIADQFIHAEGVVANGEYIASKIRA